MQRTNQQPTNVLENRASLPAPWEFNPKPHTHTACTESSPPKTLVNYVYIDYMLQPTKNRKEQSWQSTQLTHLRAHFQLSLVHPNHFFRIFRARRAVGQHLAESLLGWSTVGSGQMTNDGINLRGCSTGISPFYGYVANHSEPFNHSKPVRGASLSPEGSPSRMKTEHMDAMPH